MRSFLLRAFLILPLALVAGACHGNTVTTPTLPSPTLVTETFTGTIGINGAATHPFTTTTTGTVTATLTNMAPDSTLTIGLSMGTWNGATCAIVLANDKAVRTSVVTGTVSTIAGNLCVRIYDVGGISAPTDYEVTVIHP
jgi:hypothetical protein